MKIILGSSSPFRKQLLTRLRLDFETCSPDIDESPEQDESPQRLVERLSIAKSLEVAKQYPDALIISSDQVAVFEGEILGKPGNHDKAMAQLSAFSNKTVQFITGLCLLNAKTKTHQYHQDISWVKFRSLNQSQINNYLHIDQPYQCAGSFKSEGFGSALFRSIETSDPNALIGLPIMKLVEMLDNEGVDVFAND